MIRPRSSVLLLLLASLTACISHRSQLYVGDADYTLASHTTADGATEQYNLSVSGGGTASLTVVTRSDTGEEAENIELETSTSRKPYAGVHLRGIPAAWCERIYGEPRNAIVVARVEVGSPAWLAGMRGGDVIDEIDDLPVPPLAKLTEMIAERGENGEPMRIAVSRPGSAPHEASVDLHDYSGETNIVVPLVFHVRDGVYRDRWGIGPWGVIMNNRNTYVADSETRQVETRNVFHALLGLIRVENRPDETRVRLLWFIHFDT